MAWLSLLVAVTAHAQVEAPIEAEPSVGPPEPVSEAPSSDAETAEAPIEAVIEEVAAPQPVRQPYVQGQGRGFSYGSSVLVPLYVSELRSLAPASDSAIYVGPGVAIQARLGWELPYGLSVELSGGLGVSGLDTRGMPGRDDLFVRYDVALGARYFFFNGSPFVPFAGAAFATHFWRFQGPAPPGGMPTKVDTEVTVGLDAVLGLAIELAPWVGIEGGAHVDVTNGGNAFTDATVWVSPYLGVTMYAY